MVFRKKDSGPSNRHHAILIVSRYKIITLRRSSPKVFGSESQYFKQACLHEFILNIVKCKAIIFNRFE